MWCLGGGGGGGGDGRPCFALCCSPPAPTSLPPAAPRQVCDALEGLFPQLPPLEGAEAAGGAAAERAVETWVPKKTIKAWNPK